MDSMNKGSENMTRSIAVLNESRYLLPQMDSENNISGMNHRICLKPTPAARIVA